MYHDSFFRFYNFITSPKRRATLCIRNQTKAYDYETFYVGDVFLSVTVTVQIAQAQE